MDVVSAFEYVWVWKPHPDEPWMTQLDRQGEMCRVLARGSMNSALVEFRKDGFRAVVSRNGLRRAFTKDTEHAFRQVLAKMRLLPGASAANLEPTGSTIPDSRPPSGDGRPLADVWAGEWDHARAGEHARVLQQAEAALRAFQVRDTAKLAKVSVETQTQLEARVVEEGRGWSVKDTAIHCRVTETFVRKARANAVKRANEAAIERLTGKLSPEERRAEVLRMKENAMSNRQIAMMLGCDEITVRRDLAALREAA